MSTRFNQCLLNPNKAIGIETILALFFVGKQYLRSSSVTFASLSIFLCI